MNTTHRQKSLDAIAAAGIAGAGGAGFPAHVKLNCTAEIVVANGAECEPLLHKDKELMAWDPSAIIRGMQIAIGITGARSGIMALKKKAKSAIAALQTATQIPISIKALGDMYPAGDEVTLTYEATGRIPPPGGLPLDVGVVVSNIETLWWIGNGLPVTDKFLTVAGDVVEPVTLRVPIGMAIQEALDAAGFKGNASTHGLLGGGAMMGQFINDFDAPITKTLGGLIVLPRGHHLLDRYIRSRTSGHRIARSACDQCSFCTQLCPRYLLGHPVEPHKMMRHIAMSAPGTPPPESARYCCGCQLCSLWSCPEDLDPGWITFDYRQELQGVTKTPKLPGTTAHPMYEFRKPPIAALKRRLGLDGYIDSAPLKPMRIETDRARILLKQHVGVAAEPVVTVGERVTKGQLIARIPDGKLGVPLHASIDGVIQSIAGLIEIRRL